MSLKSIGYAMIVVGVIGLAISLLADVIGIGGYPDGIGTRQLLGAAIGLIFVVIGVVLALRKQKSEG
jgi:hypothetical protein